MYVACGTVNFRTLSLRQALDRIRRAGYEWVETQATAPFCPHVDVELNDPMMYRRIVEDMGFKGTTALWASHGALIADPLSVDYVVKSIEWAHAAGIPVVNIGDGVKPDAMTVEEAWRTLEERLLRVLEAAEEHDVCVAVEPHGVFSLTAEGLLRILSISDSPRLGVNYDTANVRRAAYVGTRAGAYQWEIVGKKQNEVETLKQVAHRVVHVHVKDVRGAECVALGEGEVNIPACIEVLKQAGYEGALSLETEGDLHPRQAQALIEKSRGYLMSLL